MATVHIWVVTKEAPNAIQITDKLDEYLLLTNKEGIIFI